MCGSGNSEALIFLVLKHERLHVGNWLVREKALISNRPCFIICLSVPEQVRYAQIRLNKSQRGSY